jgi:NAD-dependent dihydropyrimidine dehydrogenase PreA subunit
MIELLIAERCTQCNACVAMCPSNVFDAVDNASPIVARAADCQSCYMCELYCKTDALYVGPDCEKAEPVNAAEIVASGVLGQYRKHSGWDEWSTQYSNQHWLMGSIFARAAAGE